MTCDAQVVDIRSEIVVTISPLDAKGNTFQIEKLVNNAWVLQDPVYTITPPQTSKAVKVSAGDYRVQCAGGTGTGPSTSSPVLVKILPDSTIAVKRTNKFRPGQYQTLVRGVSIAAKDRTKYMKPTYRVLCRPVKKASAGEASYCVYRVTNRGGLKVKVIGTTPVRVRSIVTVRPKPRYRKDYAPIVQTLSWILKPN